MVEEQEKWMTSMALSISLISKYRTANVIISYLQRVMSVFRCRKVSLRWIWLHWNCLYNRIIRQWKQAKLSFEFKCMMEMARNAILTKMYICICRVLCKWSYLYGAYNAYNESFLSWHRFHSANQSFDYSVVCSLIRVLQCPIHSHQLYSAMSRTRRMCVSI